VKRSKIIVAVLIAFVSVGAFVTACKQSRGDRCQINDDCADGLVCNKATNTCQSMTGGGLDATVPDAKVFNDAPDAM